MKAKKCHTFLFLKKNNYVSENKNCSYRGTKRKRTDATTIPVTLNQIPISFYFLLESIFPCLDFLSSTLFDI